MIPIIATYLSSMFADPLWQWRLQGRAVSPEAAILQLSRRHASRVDSFGWKKSSRVPWARLTHFCNKTSGSGQSRASSGLKNECPQANSPDSVWRIYNTTSRTPMTGCGSKMPTPATPEMRLNSRRSAPRIGQAAATAGHGWRAKEW
jgi:hypothetical protein